MRIILRRKAPGAAFQHPIDPAPRTAILASGFAESGRTRVFPQGWTDAAIRFRPTSIAGPMKALRDLSRQDLDLQHAIIVFTELNARLTDQDRDWLWDRFGVPVFEQCLGPHNELVASECEAHEGVHMWQAVSSEWAGEVDNGKCACGSDVPRLKEQLILTATA